MQALACLLTEVVAMEEGRKKTGLSFDAVRLWTDDFDVFYAMRVKLSGELEIERIYK